MKQELDRVDFLVGDSSFIESIDATYALPIFSNEIVDFLQDLSRLLLSDKDNRQFPDIITFAFWCRRASVSEMQKNYIDMQNRLGKGVVFHIAPSNVPINFAYSLVSALLAGNINIVKVSSKPFGQVDVVCAAINAALQLHKQLKPFITIVRYGHEKELNDLFSRLCNMRVLWGGDATIDILRQSPLCARATELTFANRNSICVIDSEFYSSLTNGEKNEIALRFYFDTYLSDQNACSSPKIVVWQGSIEQEFWDRLLMQVKQKYQFHDIFAIDKQTSFCLLASEKKAVLTKDGDNRMVRLKVEKLEKTLFDYFTPGGFFMEYELLELDEIFALCDEKLQTVSYVAKDSEFIWSEIMRHRPKGIDRVVPVGRTMDFSLVWDGFDLITSMSRTIDIH